MSQMRPNYDELLSIITQLQAQIEALQTEIKELKEKLNTNSSNSSKPPSQDPYRVPVQKKKTAWFNLSRF